MYLLKFKHENNEYFLYHGGFIGGETYKECHLARFKNTARSISVGGFDIVRVTTEELADLIGGVPYPIIDFTGGFGLPMSGVKLVKDCSQFTVKEG